MRARPRKGVGSTRWDPLSKDGNYTEVKLKLYLPAEIFGFAVTFKPSCFQNDSPIPNMQSLKANLDSYFWGVYLTLRQTRHNKYHLSVIFIHFLRVEVK